MLSENPVARGEGPRTGGPSILVPRGTVRNRGIRFLYGRVFGVVG